MQLADVLTPALIKIGLESLDKAELFEEMVQVFIDAGCLHDREAALRALHEREAKMSTGVAPALALPHAKIAEAQRLLVAIGTSHAGIDYDALDGAPVHVVVMVLAAIGSPGPHIAALAEASRLFFLPGFTERVRAARSAAELLRLIAEQE